MKRLIPVLFVACSSTATPESVADTAGAGGDATGDAEEADVPSTPEGSYYDFTVAFSSSKLQQRYKGTLAPEKISFGCTHIAPAKSLAVEFTYPEPFATLNLNLGFVRGSDAHPVTITEPGAYAWGTGEENAPPSFKLVATDGAGSPQLTLGTWVAGADGTTTIDTWGTVGGEVVEGHIDGTLVNDGAFDGKAVIQGSFRIELPPEQGCGGT